jgi:hypothetical protein
MTTVDTRASIVIRPFIFRKAEWDVQGEGRDAAIKGIPSTWTTIKGLPSHILALVCCPNCGKSSILHQRIHHINHLGKVDPSFMCKYYPCQFHRDIYLDEWNKKPLYACAVMRDGKPEMHYMHATTQQEARIQLGAGNYYIVAIGRAVGFFVHDNHGDKLSAD